MVSLHQRPGRSALHAGFTSFHSETSTLRCATPTCSVGLPTSVNPLDTPRGLQLVRLTHQRLPSIQQAGGCLCTRNRTLASS